MLSQFIHIGLNNCLQCGSFGTRPSLLCFHCERTLFKTAFDPIELCSEIKRIPSLSLFQWTRDRNRTLNRLSLALKGPYRQAAWDYFAEALLREWLKIEILATSAVFVPCPSHNDKPDHAYWLAFALSKRTGIPMRNYLERTDAKEQKTLSFVERQQRAGLKFRLKENVNEKFSHVYFVDDIITTGATVLAAQTLLKKVGHVKAISLIIRR